MIEDHKITVSDPTDFPPESDAPGLRQLDSALRCGICGEIFDAPMMLQCGHSFCSMCARQSLRERHECPQCRKPAEEIHLMKNSQLEELGVNWRIARIFTLQLLSKVDRLVKEAPDRHQRPRKKRKMSGAPTPKATRRDASPGPSTFCNPTESKDETGVADAIEDSEEELLYHDYVPSSDTEENEYQNELEQVVSCPICMQQVLVKNANAHIESTCTSFVVRPAKRKRTDIKSAWENMFSGPSAKPASRPKGKGKESKQKSPLGLAGDGVERLPRPSYSVLKDKKIREMLAEHQLSTTGSKDQLIARHSQFVMLFNANLDRAEHLRKPLSELRKETEKWEDSLSVKKTTVSDPHAYMKANNLDFKKHVEAVKADKEQAKSKELGSSVEPSPGAGEIDLPGTVATSIVRPRSGESTGAKQSKKIS